MIKTTRLKTSQVPKNITYDLTPQVDGVKQTFELPEKVYDLDQHYVLFNGQVYRNDANHTFYTISADGMELTTLFDEAPRPGASYVLQFVKTEIAEGDGEQLHDAATVAQGNTLATSAPTTATAGVLGQLYTDTTAMHTYQLTAIDTTDPDNPSYTWTQRW